jgi:hypothetical protein
MKRNHPEAPIKLCGLLGEWPIPIVRLRCKKCGQIRFHMTRQLLRKFGPDKKMPELRWDLMGCNRQTYSDYCGAYLSDALAIDRARNGPIG